MPASCGSGRCRSRPRHRSHVDGVEDPAVVPPAQPRVREGGAAEAVIDPHDELVDPRLEVLHRELEREVGAGVGAELVSVEPDGGPVVDRLELKHPATRRLWHVAREGVLRDREIALVPAHGAGIARVRQTAGVERIGHRHRVPVGRVGVVLPPAAGDSGVCRVWPVQPGAAESVAVGRSVGHQRALGRRSSGGRRRNGPLDGRTGLRRGRRRDGDHRQHGQRKRG